MSSRSEDSVETGQVVVTEGSEIERLPEPGDGIQLRLARGGQLLAGTSLGCGRLCHLGSKFQEVLQITKLMTVFDDHNTEAEAVASFSK